MLMQDDFADFRAMNLVFIHGKPATGKPHHCFARRLVTLTGYSALS